MAYEDNINKGNDEIIQYILYIVGIVCTICIYILYRKYQQNIWNYRFLAVLDRPVYITINHIFFYHLYADLVEIHFD